MEAFAAGRHHYLSPFLHPLSSSPLCVQSAHASRLHFQPIPMCKRDVEELGGRLYHLDSSNSQYNVREISTHSPAVLFFLLRRYNHPSASRFSTSSRHFALLRLSVISLLLSFRQQVMYHQASFLCCDGAFIYDFRCNPPSFTLPSPNAVQ